MTIAEAAEELQVSKSRIHQLITQLGLKPRLKTVSVQMLDLSPSDMAKLRKRKTRRGPNGIHSVSNRG